MMVLWICQGFLNLVALMFFARWVLFRRQVSEPAWEEKINAALGTLELRVKKFESDAVEYRKRLDAQLARLGKLCDQATEIIQHGVFSDGKHAPSVEETELKSAIELEKDPIHIPTYEQLQKTKARLKAEMQLDLRTVLQDQLS